MQILFAKPEFFYLTSAGWLPLVSNRVSHPPSFLPSFLLPSRSPSLPPSPSLPTHLPRSLSYSLLPSCPLNAHNSISNVLEKRLTTVKWIDFQGTEDKYLIRETLKGTEKYVENLTIK